MERSVIRDPDCSPLRGAPSGLRLEYCLSAEQPIEQAEPARALAVAQVLGLAIGVARAVVLVPAPAPGLLAAVASRRDGGRAVVVLRIAAHDGALLGLAGFLLDVLATALRGFTLALAPALPRLGGGVAVAARLVGRARRRLARGLGIAGLLRVARRRSLARPCPFGGPARRPRRGLGGGGRKLLRQKRALGRAGLAGMHARWLLGLHLARLGFGARGCRRRRTPSLLRIGGLLRRSLGAAAGLQAFFGKARNARIARGRSFVASRRVADVGRLGCRNRRPVARRKFGTP